MDKGWWSGMVAANRIEVMLLEGLFLPLTTPFYPDGTLNLRKLEHNTGRYSLTPAAGLMVLSETGEPSLLDEAEMRKVLESAMEAAAAEKVMVAGVSRDSAFGTLKLADQAARLGYDAVLVRVPRLLDAGRRKEMLTFFQAVADRAVLPVILESGVGAGIIDEDVAIELAQHGNVIGMVDHAAIGDRVRTMRAGTAGVKRDVTVTTVFAAATDRMLAKREGPGGGTFVSADSLSQGGSALAVEPPKAAIRTRTKTVGFQIIAGQSAGLVDALRAGAAGAMPPLAACAPQACYEVYAAWKDGDEALALEKQARLGELTKLMEGRLGVPGIRYGCDLTGYFGGRPRLPLLPVTGEEKQEIELLMSGIKN